MPTYVEGYRFWDEVSVLHRIGFITYMGHMSLHDPQGVEALE